ncbi:MAG: hypothetical protein ACREA0_32480, partial [bacterium]
CDLTGQPLPDAPKWGNTLTTVTRYPLGAIPGVRQAFPFSLDAFDLTAGFTVEYEDVQSRGFPGDRRFRQPSFFRLKANLGLANAAQGWSLRITGDNLSNVVTRSNIQEIAGVTHLVQDVDPPRLIFGQVRWEF